MGFDPSEWPIDRHDPAGCLHRGDHPPRGPRRCGEWLFDEQVRAVGCQPFRVVGVVGGRGAENGEVGLRCGHAGVEVRKHPIFRNCEIGYRLGHPRRIRIEDAGNHRVRMLMHLAQQITHVHVVEADGSDAKIGHLLPPL